MRLSIWLVVALVLFTAACTGGEPRPRVASSVTPTPTAAAATPTPSPPAAAAPTNNDQPRTIESGATVAQAAPAPAAPASPALRPAAAAPPASAAPVTIVPFTTSGGAMISIADLEGAILQGGQNGITYLGVISTSRTNADSICNQNGAYGSVYGAMSVRNRGGEFGHIPSETSAYDPTAPLPPRILLKNARVGYLTKNVTIDRGVFDPDLVFAALGCS